MRAAAPETGGRPQGLNGTGQAQKRGRRSSRHACRSTKPPSHRTCRCAGPEDHDPQDRRSQRQSSRSQVAKPRGQSSSCSLDFDSLARFTRLIIPVANPAMTPNSNSRNPVPSRRSSQYPTTPGTAISSAIVVIREVHCKAATRGGGWSCCFGTAEDCDRLA